MLRSRLLDTRSPFAKNVLTVAGGTAMAQAIPVLAGPVLTRLYAPDAFGEFALYLAAVAIGTVVVTGRYELAILLPRDDAEARDLLGVALVAATVLSAVALTAILLATGPMRDLAAFPSVPRWAVWVPLGLLFAAAAQSVGYWLNRKARYRPLVAGRVAQSASMIGVQGAAGTAYPWAATLVVGHVFGQLTSAVVLARNALRLDAPLLRGISWAGLRRAAAVHRRFPLFIAPGHVANAVSAHLPTILLAAFFGPAIAGLFSLAERVLVLPTSLIANSIGDVYRQEAAATYHRQGECRDLYLRTLRRLALLSVVPCAIVIAAGPWLFATAFGSAWRESGVLASMLAAMVFFQMISSPLSQTVLLANMHRVELAWQLARVAVAGGAILIGHAVLNDHRAGVALYAAGFAVLHLLHSVLQYRAASGHAAFAGTARPLA